jgi:hypothetical protein
MWRSDGDLSKRVGRFVLFVAVVDRIVAYYRSGANGTVALCDGFSW